MWSVAVVAAMGASSHLGVTVTADYHTLFLYFQKNIKKTYCLCSLMGVHGILNSATHHFTIIIFLKNQQKKLLFRCFFISQTCNYTNHTFFFFVRFVDLWGSFSTDLILFSICVVIQKSHCVSELNDWVLCVFVSVLLSLCAEVIEMTGCFANWGNSVLQVRREESHLWKKEKITACY